MNAKKRDLYSGLRGVKCKMCQLTELLAPRKLIDFCSKSGRTMLQPECLEWLDIKFFHIKIMDASGFDREPPENLTVHYLPRNSLTILEVNGAQIRPSASAFVTLRRTAFDSHSSEAIYLSTDSVRTTGNLCFEVYVRDETLICGVLERRENSVKKNGDQGLRQPTWNVQCTCSLDDPSTWISTITGGGPSFPVMELYVAGREDSWPFVLTCTEQLIPRRKRTRRGVTLDVIPEGNDYENSFTSTDFEESEFQGGKGTLIELDNRAIALTLEAATQRLSNSFQRKRVGFGRGWNVSWVKAGVRLGVGIGLGMCFGLCMGTCVLMMRAYQGTTRKRENNDSTP